MAIGRRSFLSFFGQPISVAPAMCCARLLGALACARMLHTAVKWSVKSYLKLDLSASIRCCGLSCEGPGADPLGNDRMASLTSFSFRRCAPSGGFSMAERSSGFLAAGCLLCICLIVSGLLSHSGSDISRLHAFENCPFSPSRIACVSCDEFLGLVDWAGMSCHKVKRSPFNHREHRLLM